MSHRRVLDRVPPCIQLRTTCCQIKLSTFTVLISAHPIMAGKRPADGGSQPKARQFKQTKLNFRSFSKAAKPPQDEGSRDTTTTTPTSTDLTRSPQKDSPALSPPAAENQDNKSTEEKPNPPTTIPPTPTPTAQPTPKAQQIRITDLTGDLFSAPPDTVLIHACNAIGSWGGGIALAFRQHYPEAYAIYAAHCKRSLPQRLVGTALLIAPRSGAPPSRQHYVGCLFTSKRYGRAKDSPEMILQATGPAMRDLLGQIAREGEKVGEIRMCRINSGLFAVPWGESKRVIEGLQLDEEEVPAGRELPLEILAYSLD